MERLWLALAGMSGAVAVGAEAAARHLLAQDPYRLDLAATSGRYGLVHGVALLAVATLSLNWQLGMRRLWLVLAGWCFSAGLILFCGSLYALALGAPPEVARATPIGGIAFIAGWVALVFAAVQPRPAR